MSTEIGIGATMDKEWTWLLLVFIAIIVIPCAIFYAIWIGEYIIYIIKKKREKK